MKTLNSLFFFLSLLFAARSSDAQGSFQNLGFESAMLVPIPGDSFNRLYFDQAFPGWRGYVGGIQETAAFHNGSFLCCSAISVWGGGTHPDFAIDGSFSVFLHAAWGPDAQPANTSLAQTALVPAEARSLLFKAQLTTGLVSLGGSLLPIIPLSTGSNYTLFGADISPWAGQESELRFTAVAPASDSSFWVLDSIQFSSEPIPEPSTYALFAVAGVLGWFYLRHKRR